MSGRLQRGFSMIEVLVTIAILMAGLLGLAGLQARVSTAELEAYQRAQAIVLLQEMADRMSANKKNLAAYVANNIGSAGVKQDCTGKTGAALDLCQFNNDLIGAAETSAGNNVGAMIGGRACITNPTLNVYYITVVWQGMVRTAQPATNCGAGAYGDDTLRRAISVPVRFATLTVP